MLPPPSLNQCLDGGWVSACESRLPQSPLCPTDLLTHEVVMFLFYFCFIFLTADRQ